MTAPIPLSERKRRAMRVQLSDIAMNLFARNGYDGTTIDDVLAVAGVSKRTFFRYFDSKPELVLGNLEWVGEELAERFAGRPADESPWLALRRSYDRIFERVDADPGRAAALLRMLEETPALTAALLARRSNWRDLLAPVVAERLDPAGSTPDDPRASALAGASLACYEVALRRWLDTARAGELALLMDEAMSALAPLSVSRPARSRRAG